MVFLEISCLKSAKTRLDKLNTRIVLCSIIIIVKGKFLFMFNSYVNDYIRNYLLNINLKGRQILKIMNQFFFECMSLK
jgi:hypothetical protein